VSLVAWKSGIEAGLSSSATQSSLSLGSVDLGILLGKKVESGSELRL